MGCAARFAGSTSGRRRSAWLEGGRPRSEVIELGLDYKMKEIAGIGQQQNGRPGEQHRACERHNGANSASVAVLIVTCRFGWTREERFDWCCVLRLYSRRGWGSGRVTGCHGWVGLHRDGRRLEGCSTVMMSERQHKLDCKREQREPRSVFKVRPEPLHCKCAHARQRYLTL